MEYKLIFTQETRLNYAVLSDIIYIGRLHVHVFMSKKMLDFFFDTKIKLSEKICVRYITVIMLDILLYYC